jgi:DNA topoisomerase VI subunit B
VFVRRRRREADEHKKRSYIEKYIPHIGDALQEILGFSDRRRDKAVSNLKTVLERSRKL